MPFARDLLSYSRAAVGVGTWAAPSASWRLFGLGDLAPSGPVATAAGSAEVMTRLFAARDLVLGAGLRHPSPDVRRAVLQAGIAMDLVDATASVIGVRRGAPARSLVGVTAGALLLAALGAAALRDES